MNAIRPEIFIHFNYITSLITYVFLIKIIVSLQNISKQEIKFLFNTKRTLYNMESFLNTDVFIFIILPILIFLSRIFDQSIGILRIIFATKGLKLPAFLAGFFESMVWLIAISQIMNHLDNVFCYLAFAGGFATGNVVGIYLEQKLSMGFLMVRVIFQKDSDKTIALLREANFRLTITDAMGMEQPVKMVFSTILRSKLKEFLSILEKNNPNAFFTIEDVKMVKEGYSLKRESFFKRNQARK